jgi:hypothetical protein
VVLHDGARTSIDEEELQRDLEEHYEMRRLEVIDDAARQFAHAVNGDTGLARQGLTGVCAALRDGAVETLIIGDLADRTVVIGETLGQIAPNADLLSDLGAAPNTTVRADEALPLLVVSTDSALIRTDERIDPTDGFAAVALRAARLTDRRDRQPVAGMQRIGSGTAERVLGAERLHHRARTVETVLVQSLQGLDEVAVGPIAARMLGEGLRRAWVVKTLEVVLSSVTWYPMPGDVPAEFRSNGPSVTVLVAAWRCCSARRSSGALMDLVGSRHSV